MLDELSFYAIRLLHLACGIAIVVRFRGTQGAVFGGIAFAILLVSSLVLRFLPGWGAELGELFIISYNLSGLAAYGFLLAAILSGQVRPVAAPSAEAAMLWESEPFAGHRPEGPMEWMLLPYARYAEFSGRSQRKEYWMFVLLVSMVELAFVVALLGGSFDVDTFRGWLDVAVLLVIVLFFLASLVPGIALQVRRLHDQDRSGWWILIGFVPYLGAIVLLVFMLFDGTPGPNRYGPDPKGRVTGGAQRGTVADA